MKISKMHSNFEKMLMVLKIIAFDLLAGVYVNYDKNTSNRTSTFQKAVLGFQMPLRDIKPNSIYLILIEH